MSLSDQGEMPLSAPDRAATKLPVRSPAEVERSFIAEREAQADELLYRQMMDSDDEVPNPEVGWGKVAADVAEGGANFLGDVGYGAYVEGLPQIGQGARDAFNELAGLMDSSGALIAEEFAEAIGDKKTAEGIRKRRAAGENVLKDLLPNVADKAQTTTGQIIHDVSQFGTGVLTGGKALKTAGWGAQGLKKALASGALSDFAFFDPKQARFANMIEENFPSLKGPILDFMKADPGNENEMMARLKRAAEGAGLGLAATKAIGAMMWGAKTIGAARTAIKAKAPITPEDFSRLGDKTKGAFEATEYNAKTNKYGGVELNHAGVKDVDDIQKALSATTEKFQRNLDKGEKVHIATNKLMKGERGAFDELVNARTQGGMAPALGDAERSALEKMYTDAGRKVLDMARQVGLDETPANMFGLRRAQAIQNVLRQTIVHGKPTPEAIQNFSRWAMPNAKTAQEELAAITQALDRQGGHSPIIRMAKEIRDNYASKTGRVGQLSEKASKATTMDALVHAYTSALLWNPGTQITNIASNAAFMAQNMAERKLAEWVPRAQKGGDEALQGIAGHVEPGEAAAMMGATNEAFRDALGYAFKSGRKKLFGGPDPGDAPEIVKNMRDAWTQQSSAFNAAQAEGGPNALVRWAQRAPIFRPDTPGGKVAQLVGNVWGGSHRALAMTDEMFKTVLYKQEVAALARRHAQQELRSGRLGKGDYARRYEELRANPSNEMHDEAMKYARYGTFQEPPEGFTRKVMEFAHEYPALRILLMPFINTPANIMKRGFERSPFGFAMSRNLNDLRAGGSRADLATARLGLGNAITGMVADAAMRGDITGSPIGTPGQRELQQRLGKPAYSVKMGDTYVPYQGWGPIGLTMGAGANLSRLIANSDWDEEDKDDAASAWLAYAAQTGGQALDSSYLDKSAQIADVLTEAAQGKMDADAIRRSIESFGGDVAGGFIPSIFGTIEKGMDPRKRQMQLPGDWLAGDVAMAKVLQRLPFLSEMLPVQHDVWGREIDRSRNSIFGSRNPYSADEPIDKELEALGASINSPSKNFSMTPDDAYNMFRERIDFGPEVSLRDSLDIHDRLKTLAGGEVRLKDYNNMTALEFMNALVSGEHPKSKAYQKLVNDPEGGNDSKIAFLRGVMNDFRKAAKKELLNESPELEQMLYDEIGRRNRKYRE